MNTLKAWVAHYTPLTERKAFQKAQLDKEGIEHVFITEHDREVLTREDLFRFNVGDSSSHLMGSISLILKHLATLRHIKESSHPFNLLMEDDAIFEENFSQLLPKALKELPVNYDMLFLGTCWNLHIPLDQQIPGQLLYKKGSEATGWGGDGATRCTDSVIISKNCASKILDYYEEQEENSISKAFDWWLNSIIRELTINNIYWLEPTIVSQGSNPGNVNNQDGYEGKKLFPDSY
jgi:GR25 family glycosyltransferase involved in LPS biosynthesis